MSAIVKLVKLVKNSKAAIPPISGTIKLEGLHTNVEILWDNWGIPHIFSENMEDAFYCEGLIHAQYRLFQMELYRRRYSGKLSEIFGEATLEWDKYMRSVGLHRVARIAADKLMKIKDSDTFKILNAYVKGINAGIERAKNTPPMEFLTLGYIPEPWTFEDAFLLISVLDYMESYNVAFEILREKLIQKLGKEMANKIIPLFEGISSEGVQGSNAWAIRGEKTQDGKNLLMNDPHLAFSQPILWFIVHINCPNFNVIGVTLPGDPAIIIGHNENIAWGITNVASDSQDIYKIQKNPDNPNQYKLDGKWVDFQTIPEPIKIKGNEKPHDYYIQMTKFGPLIRHFEYSFKFYQSGLEGDYALKWTGHKTDCLGCCEAFLNINRSKNWEDFKKNIHKLTVVAHNFMFSDIEGNIGHIVSGQLPLRNTSISITAQDGTHSENDWAGIVNPEKLPLYFNPPNGVLLNANYNLDKTPGGVILKKDDVKKYRWMRLEQLLKSKDTFTIEDMKKFQFDTKTTQAEEILPFMIAGVEKTIGLANDGNAQEMQEMRVIIDLIKKWDYNLSVHSTEGIIFVFWYYALLRKMLIPVIGEEIYNQFIGNNPFSIRYLKSHFINDEEKFSQILKESLQSTITVLTERLGKDIHKWQYGQIHTVTLEHPFSMVNKSARIFNIGPYPVGGDRNTINNGHDSPVDDYQMKAGASLRQILVPKDWDKSWMSIPGGQYGLPFNKHYKDLMKLWVNGEYFPYLFSKHEIEKNLEGKLVYNP